MRFSESLTRRALIGLATGVIVAGLALLVFLAFDVLRNLRLLDTASSDNVQWTLAQAEVEFLEMQTEVISAQASDAPDLGLIRREFDIFYSRVQTLRQSPLYGALQQDPVYARALEQAQDFLAAGVPIIDSDDAAMRAALPQLAALLTETRPAIRTLSVEGLEYFATQADLRREGVAITLLRLAVATGALLFVLGFSAAVLAWLYRVSDRRARMLQNATERLGTIISTSLDGIVVVDTMGRIVEFSDAAERIFGHDRADVIGANMGDLIVPDSHRQAHHDGMTRYRQTGKKKVVGAGRMSLVAQRADGKVFPVEVSIQSAQSESGEIFVGFIRDISRRVAQEQELVSARDAAVAGDKAKTEFLAVMSHEIRTPLNGLLGTLSLLKDTKLDPRQRDFIQTMDDSGALLLNHVNDVLDISKYEAGKLTLDVQPTVVADLAQSVIDNQRDIAIAAGNRIGWDWVGAPVAAVETDPFRLRQVLINLVGNAVKFTRDGDITLEIEADRGAEPTLTFRVRDTGVGIDPAQIDRLFNDFETGDSSYGRAAGGTGLGLGIARRIADALGGRIGADSVPGAGSTFWVELPLRAVEMAGPASPGLGETAPRDARPLQTLVVEDNAINRTVLSEMLRHDGHTVVEATNGEEGVRLSATRPFDVILMDVSMPVMDGRVATRTIRDGTGPNARTPVVAVTAHALPAEIADFRTHGMDHYLSKPIDRADLRRLMAEIGGAPGEAAAPPPQAQADPLIDPDHLATLIDDMGETIAATLLQRFRGEARDSVARITDQAGTGDTPDALAREVHKLAGSAGTFGAVRLRLLLAEIETACKTGDLDTARARAADLPNLWAETEGTLAEIADGLASA